MHWSDEFEQGANEPLEDYVKRLEQAKEAPGLKNVVSSMINANLKAATKDLRDMKAQLRKTPTTRDAEAARKESPALREVKRLFAGLTDGERQQFFLWWSGPHPETRLPKGKTPASLEFEKIRADKAEHILAGKAESPPSKKAQEEQGH